MALRTVNFFLPSEMHFVDYYQIKKGERTIKNCCTKRYNTYINTEIKFKNWFDNILSKKNRKGEKIHFAIFKVFTGKILYNSNFLVQMSGWWLCGEK